MPHFQYRALNLQGKITTGQLDASNLPELEQRLKQQQLGLIDAKIKRQRWSRQRINRQELITLFANLAQLTQAGIPLLDSLYDLRDACPEGHLRQVLHQLLEDISGGKSLSQAMKQHEKVFNPVLLSLVIAGEHSGKLPEIFQQITVTLKWQDEMAAHNKNILLYPSLMAIVVISVALFLLLYLVPNMQGFIQTLGQNIPWHTQLLLQVSAFLRHYWYVLLVLPLLMGIALYVTLQRSPAAQFLFDQAKLQLWLIGPLRHKIILARFANTFALMYRAGINVLACVAHARTLVNNRVIAQGLDEIYRDIEAGKNLTQSFQKTGLFPPLVIRMLKVGESTGALDSALLNVSYFYDRDIQDQIKRLQTLMEPSMTIVLGITLGWVMLSVLSPIYEVIGSGKF